MGKGLSEADVARFRCATRLSAMLVCGADHYGHFDDEPGRKPITVRPSAPFTPQRWRGSARPTARRRYATRRHHDRMEMATNVSVGLDRLPRGRRL
jgi:hypothetical protein